MKLLIITQAVDETNDTLGFFHSWILEFSKVCEQVTVICLEQGVHHLPANVRVCSLGKESGRSRLKYLLNFYKLIWRYRRDYQTVFVHMNQEYVLLAGWFWKLFGKKIYFWRNHRQGNLATQLAVGLSNLVFYTSPQSYTARFAKARRMPVGIDTGLFKSDPAVKREPRSILALGRISPVKELKSLIRTLLELHELREEFTATVVGSPAIRADEQYERDLRVLAEPLTRSGLLKFVPAIPHNQTASFYQSHDICVNLTRPGSFDKTILEAAACGCVPFSPHDEVGVILPDLDPRKNALRIAGWFKTEEQRKNEIRLQLNGFVKDNHSLAMLARNLLTVLK